MIQELLKRTTGSRLEATVSRKIGELSLVLGNRQMNSIDPLCGVVPNHTGYLPCDSFEMNQDSGTGIDNLRGQRIFWNCEPKSHVILTFSKLQRWLVNSFHVHKQRILCKPHPEIMESHGNSTHPLHVTKGVVEHLKRGTYLGPRYTASICVPFRVISWIFSSVTDTRRPRTGHHD